MTDGNPRILRKPRVQDDIDFTDDERNAFRNLNAGNPSPGQCHLVIQCIVSKIANFNGEVFHADPLETAFAAGKRYVGRQIALAIRPADKPGAKNAATTGKQYPKPRSAGERAAARAARKSAAERPVGSGPAAAEQPARPVKAKRKRDNL